ncbi:HAMP domain-containing histidine kinase [Prolixibacteraceae bacterium JC049]|nr:HAMP domain-containing histidine kinase [Prolixibacteraceae bacterium JC049]
MKSGNLSGLITEWADEFSDVISSGNCIYVCLLDENGKVKFINNAFNELMKGKGSENFLNPNVEALLSKNNDGNIFDGYLTIGDNDSLNRSIEAKIYRKENQLLLLGGINANDLFEQNEKVFALNAENQNLQRELIREKKLLQTTLHKLNISNDELSKLLTEKDKFISLLVHDIKGPFNSLLGFVYLLKNNIEDLTTEELKKYAELIGNTTERTNSLLNDIIVWYKAQSGKITFTPQLLDLNDFCKEVVADAQLNGRRKNINVSLLVRETVKFRADENMLKTILRNLLSNAIKFTKERGKVALSAKIEEQQIIFKVTDNGVGISKEDIAKILNESVSYTTIGASGEKGTGIGVNLCIDLIRKHGGNLHIESTLGKGSEFWFEVPINNK